MRISLLKKIVYRIVKQIQIVSPDNITLHSSSQLCQNSILNATKGTIALGKHTRIGNSTELVSEENKKLIVKDYSTIYSNCKLLGDIEIERYCTLATNIYMSSGNHYAFHQPELLVKIQDKIVLGEEKGRVEHNKKIHIHEDVWIGNGAFISRGVTIGRGAVIGANSVVTKDVEPYSVMVGIPAKKIKNRLDYNPPIELNCEVIETYPYFYNGFNHFHLPELLKINGFQLIDTGIIHVSSNTSITFKGNAIQPTEVKITINSMEFVENLSLGNFSFTLNNLPLMEESYLTINIESTVKNSVYLKQVISN